MSDIDWLGLANKQYISRFAPNERYRKPSLPGTPLRAARHRAHERFDLIWRRGYLTRSEAYAWLAVQMEMPEGDCHMGMLSREECAKVEALAVAYLKARELERKAPKLGAIHDQTQPTTPDNDL
jgi:hypothetical protein